MKITRYLKPAQISLELNAADKQSALESLLKILVDTGGIPKDKTEELLKSLIEREAQASTGLGYGVALPHVKTNVVDKIQIAFGRSAKGIDFEALDENPAHFFFLILAPINEVCEHLKVLSLISLLMKDKNNRHSLLRAKTPEEIFRILDKTM
jgi:mannitol/fructose-specific phosphotransferase system IIA component (Ntr-type)